MTERGVECTPGAFRAATGRPPPHAVQHLWPSGPVGRAHNLAAWSPGAVASPLPYGEMLGVLSPGAPWQPTATPPRQRSKAGALPPLRHSEQVRDGGPTTLYC